MQGLLSNQHIKNLMEQRSTSLITTTSDFLFDFSRQNIDDKLWDSFSSEYSSKTLNKIREMFLGYKINYTEKRPVLHYLNRWPLNDSENLKNDLEKVNKDLESQSLEDKADILNEYSEIEKVAKKVNAFVDSVRSGEFKLGSNKPVKDIVCIGIGGSFLGTKSVYTALKEHPKYNELSQGRQLHFIANVDPMSVYKVMNKLDVSQTLVVVISKSFTTQETLQNMNLVSSWMLKKFNDSGCKLSKEELFAGHFVVVSANNKKVNECNISDDKIFNMFDHTGGRFSVSSAVGTLPLGIVFGNETVNEFLAGMHSMDRQFFCISSSNDFKQNISAVMGYIDFHNINALEMRSKAIVPYNDELGDFIAHLQQLDMESSGKFVEKGKNSSSQVIFGDVGTNAQHSFFQLLHQSETKVPVDFVGFCKSQIKLNDYLYDNEQEDEDLYDGFMANMLAQTEALAQGRENKEEPHRNFEGNRPTTVLLFKGSLDAKAIGMLLALYENRVSTKGFLAEINSYDQYGVELGKVMCKELIKNLKNGYEKQDNPLNRYYVENK